LKPDIIKIRVDDNLGTTTKMPPDVYRAVIDEAHRRGLRVAVHIFYLQDAKDVLRAGADIIAHSVRDTDIDDEFISLMKARNVPYCPTLTREVSTFVYESTPPFFSDPFFLREADRDLVAQLQEPARQEAMRNSKAAQGYKAGLAVARRNLKKAAEAGLLIVMGGCRSITRAFSRLLRAPRNGHDAGVGAHRSASAAIGHRQRSARAEGRRPRVACARSVGRLRRARRKSAARHPQLAINFWRVDRGESGGPRKVILVKGEVRRALLPFE
jgi:hypothetical protein